MIKAIVISCLLLTNEIFSMQNSYSLAWQDPELCAFVDRCASIAKKQYEPSDWQSVFKDGEQLVCKHKDFQAFIYSHIERALDEAYSFSIEDKGSKNKFPYFEIRAEFEKSLQKSNSK